MTPNAAPLRGLASLLVPCLLCGCINRAYVRADELDRVVPDPPSVRRMDGDRRAAAGRPTDWREVRVRTIDGDSALIDRDFDVTVYDRAGNRTHRFNDPVRAALPTEGGPLVIAGEDEPAQRIPLQDVGTVELRKHEAGQTAAVVTVAAGLPLAAILTVVLTLALNPGD